MFFKVKENGQNIFVRDGSVLRTLPRCAANSLRCLLTAPRPLRVRFPYLFFPTKKTALQADFFMVELRGIEPLTS